MDLKDRFLKYVSFDTQSDESSDSFPSTEGQAVLLQYLADEMHAIGLTEVATDGQGYVTGTVPATVGCGAEPVIGFLAHVDTSPDMTGRDVEPQIIENYDGGDIRLGGIARDMDGGDTSLRSVVAHDGNGDAGEAGGNEIHTAIYMRIADFPELVAYRGHTVIHTDGTTLLGADDKAGVAEIMTAAEWLVKHPEIAHGKIRIAFTSDEEIGRGVDRFDVAAFGADFAYTVDGGALGELEFENFNAAVAKVAIRGSSIHPGYAKGKMVNALRVAEEFDAMLPAAERPETTEGYEGFYHLTRLNGVVERAGMEYIIRDHDSARFEQRKAVIGRLAARLDAKYGPGRVEVTLHDQYYNMREVLERHPEVVERAKKAMLAAGIEPVVRPIRGGTDGARLSFMGLPCPNIFTGGLNFHGKYECVSLDAMHKAVETIINIAACTTDRTSRR